ncbi:CRISPR-associated RAMP Cmr2 [Anaerovibrio sp. JC8]|uniref:type III-B CRISPR-associated protein Cas10/Cmr2 n=1 Tax=Anaerovibrio sp. JC8 TaxID=1240085 RepID=UPI000A09B913|nr:type III-B CRISPR-associated protein Cas10/Cmr2 [Anaerovibrio sp. JC8]ORU00267.1 CRISPR-associated RAMP Cmr2 [Anaerovibrio sp. JC8]
MSYYLGITNGPILNTLNDACSPAGLWFASTFFSNLTRRLCKAFLDKYQNGVDILSPHFESGQNDFLQDGVGKYHDRIILKLSIDQNLDEVNKAVKKIMRDVKAESINDFPKQYHNIDGGPSFLENYLQCHYVLLTEENVQKIEREGNVILKISPYLDALELMQTCPVDDKDNLFYKILTNKENNRNRTLKDSLLFKKVPEYANQLLDSDDGSRNIWSIEDIASCHGIHKHSDLKKYNYFAVVQADGDRMGALLNSIDEDEEVKAFSKNCMEYAREASAKVGEFGGMTIYAGGDDLLFLAPVENDKGVSVFKLCDDLNALFVNKMNSKNGNSGTVNTTLSFGIAIQHKKAPLYEALKNAAHLLFDVAKQEPKNNMAVELQKHSGQTVGLCIPVPAYTMLREKYEVVAEKLGEIIDRKKAQFKDISTVGSSVIQTIYQNSNIMAIMDEAVSNITEDDDGRQQLWYGWKNFQDNVGQADFKEYYKAIVDLYYDCFLKNDYAIVNLGTDSDCKDKNLQALVGFLKLNKFLLEKAGEEE